MAFDKKRHLQQNIDAIRLAFSLSKEGRIASSEEKLMLKKFSGFGGLKFILNPIGSAVDINKWKMGDRTYFPVTEELFRLVRDNSATLAEYQKYVTAVKSSILDAFYTPGQITKSIAKVIKASGVKISTLLEPAAGVGAFIDPFQDVKDIRITAYEQDLLTGKILQNLYSDEVKVHVEGFENIPGHGGGYDVVIGNIPFGTTAVFDLSYSRGKDPARKMAAQSVHNYFFLKATDQLREGGILAFITSQGILNSPSNQVIREALMREHQLVSAIRLPNNLFEESGTTVGTDLIVLQKNTRQRELSGRALEFTGIVQNCNLLFYKADNIISTRSFQATDQYGKLATIHLHDGGIDSISDDLETKLTADFANHFNRELYNSHQAYLPSDSVFSDQVVQQVQKYGMLLQKFPNQRSMHSCGIIISEETLTNFTTLEMPPKGFPIVQWDMHVAEEIGFEKFDILSQRGLGTINDTVRLIEEKRGIKVNIKDTSISKDEKLCNEFLSKGKTIGCFYIESPAMRGLLRKLKCDNYKVLVAASSIIRPGVAQSGMMTEYVFRHNNPDKFEYFHPVFEQQLGETYGIMVYQEDVIKIALHYGGVSAADGDILRRAMSGKGRSLSALQKVKDDFFSSCRQQGHPEELSQEIYRQIESFAGYSFCKAHSASYAVESYQSLYLKVYYPLEFMVSAINNMGGFYRTEVYVHEAKMSGGKILNPCVNKSEYETTIFDDDIFLGLMLLENVEAKIAKLIPEERRKNGEFRSMEAFIKRIPIGIETLQTLIFIGAFRFTGVPKNELLIRARLLLGEYKPQTKLQTLFEEPIKEFKFPELKRNIFEDAFDEIEILSFPVSCSPFDLLQTKYRGSTMAKDLTTYHKKQVKMLGYLISRKHVPTNRGTMFFGTWIDVNGDYFDTAHFADCLKKYPFQGGGCYLLLGTVEVNFHFPTITITKMAKMPFIPDPRYSHDEEKRYETQERMKEDVSMTFRAPYPQEHEIGLPRVKV